MATKTKEEAIATRTQAKERKAENNVLSEDELSAKHLKEAEMESDRKQVEAENAVEETPADVRPYGDNERNNHYYKVNQEY